MIKVGLTGGIGSGKSTIAGFFKDKGVPVYYTDDEAKILMVSDKDLKSGIISLLGKEAYIKDTLNRAFIASKVFGNSLKLSQLNALVHPAVRSRFDQWCINQSSRYVIQEAAVLFETGGYVHCDFTILVTAPQEMRIQRVQKRDGVTREQVISRMGAQWEDFRKMALADCTLENIDLEKSRLGVDRLHTHLTRRIDKGWS